jgi:hypothetical protein
MPAKPLLLPLQPPEDSTPEAWLARMDESPTILPNWPESKRLAIVMVEKQAKTGYTEAWVVLSEAGLELTFTRNFGNRLYFKVPRQSLLKSPDVCPELAAESWH